MKFHVKEDTYEERYKKIVALEAKKAELKKKYMPVLERTDAYRKAARGHFTDAYMSYKTEMDNIDRHIRAIENGDHKFICYLNNRRREETTIHE